MFERTVDLQIEQAFADLKAFLLKKGCKILVEEPPTYISVRQGSLWGISPRTAKKAVKYRLSPVNHGTRIAYSSSLSADWKNLTVIGSAFAVFVASLCWWIAMDLEAFMITQQPSYWSWIASVDGYIDFQVGQMFASLTKVLTLFLVIILAVEVGVVVYAHFRINSFAEESLKELT
jgi:hypothetical protein